MRARLLVVALILASTLSLAQQSGGGGGQSGGGSGTLTGLTVQNNGTTQGTVVSGTPVLNFISGCSSAVLSGSTFGITCTGGDTVTSPNSTLTVGGTSSATTLDLNLGNANTWAGTQTFGTIIPTTIGGSPNFSQTTGTAPFSVASTTVVTNLNAGSLNGKTFVNPGPIGSTTAAAGAFTTMTATQLLSTGIVDGQAPVTITTGTTATLGGTYNSGYTINHEATAATGVTYTLPTAAAGKQYCIKNGYNGTAGDTGALTLITSAAGQFIIYNGALSATHGQIASGGALGDAACVVGIDATHWEAYVQQGTWTLT